MQMSRRPLSSARRASTMPRRSRNVWPKTRCPQPRSRTTSSPMPRVWCCDGCFHDLLVIAGVDGTAVRRRRPATLGCDTEASSDGMRLQPELEQAELPELVATQRRELTVRVVQQLADVLGAEQPALTGRLTGQRVADQTEHLALEVGDRGH